MEFKRANEERTKRIKDAQEMHQTVARNCERTNSAVPPYEFLELIGKGAFGRVYKCRSKNTGNLVAVKITTIDESDFNESFDRMDDSLRDFRKEVAALQQLKDSKTKNVNVIHDAFDLHSQLWIIADYCTGGSVRTLLRPFQKGLPETYIIPIARELIVALKGMHEIGMIHRDVKCANVYVTEDGDIQVGDFGIVGILEDGASSKRKTVVGTPHWLPKELVNIITGVEDGEVQYGRELDIWSYGITLYEMATGNPPHSHLPLDHRLAEKMQEAPRLQGDQYSRELKDLIAFCLQQDQQARPTAQDILNHPYLANTAEDFPTINLVNLIEAFKVWEFGGGSRQSLWMANPSDFSSADDSVDMDFESEGNLRSSDGWNFSTSENFDEKFGRRISMMLDPQDLGSYVQASGGVERMLKASNPILSVQEQLRQEWADRSAERGEKSLERLFNPDGDYQLHTPIVGTSYSSTPALHTPSESPPTSSDLPLRTYTNDAPTRESMVSVVDLDLATPGLGAATTSSSAVFDFGTDLTIKGPSHEEEDSHSTWRPGQQLDDKRATMEWKFPPEPLKRSTMAWTFDSAGETPSEPDEPNMRMHLPPPGEDGELPAGFRPRLNRNATEPVAHFRDFSTSTPYGGVSSASRVDDYRGSMIDLDAALSTDPTEFAASIGRSATASSNSDSTKTDETSSNPFDLEEDPHQKEIDADRFSYHKQWRSEGGHDGHRARHSRRSQMHARGNSLISNGSDTDRYGSIHGDYLSMANHESQGIGYEQGLSGEDWSNFNRFDPGTNSSHLHDFQFPFTNAAHDPNAGDSYLSASHTREDSNDVFGASRVHFPSIEPPHLRALAEDCDETFLGDELGRQMETLVESLQTLSDALKLNGRLGEMQDESDFPLSDLDPDFGSTREVTEDEGESGTDRSSTRRKPRKLELRTPQTPGLALAPE